MRRKDREMDAEFALEVLDKAPYITVSMTRLDGTAYGILDISGEKSHLSGVECTTLRKVAII